MGSKICSVCKEDKDYSEFWNSKKSKDGKGYRCKPCDTAARHSYKEKNREVVKVRQRNQHLEMKYGITSEEYDKMLEAQGGCCAVCGTDKPTGEGSFQRHLKNMAVDHCHETGRVRGLLCNKCNRGIGLLRDDPELLRKAADYLEVH